MIEIKDIETEIANLLKKKGFTVVASEVKEGFPRPSCFIEVMPVNASIENQFSELITDSVEISYFPAIETKEELIKTAEKFKNIFLYTPLKVEDRYLSVNEISFDADKSVLKVYFEVEFLQETKRCNRRIPKMENLEERVVTESNGTS